MASQQIHPPVPKESRADLLADDQVLRALQENNDQLVMRIPAWLKESVARYAAAEHGGSMAAAVRWILHCWLQEVGATYAPTDRAPRDEEALPRDPMDALPTPR